MDFLKRAWAEIDLDAVEHNLDRIRQAAAPRGIMAVIKADAYGHGAVGLAHFYETRGVDWFAVSNIDEALELRQAGLRLPILILGYTPPECAGALAANDIATASFSPSYARALSAAAQAAGVQVRVHIKLDTGMSRIGFHCRSDDALRESLPEITACAGLPGLIAEGLFTHFAAADFDGDPDGALTQGQYRRFVRALDGLRANGVSPDVIHCCNSAAIASLKDTVSTLVRPGITLYGLDPTDGRLSNLELVPAMTFLTAVAMVKAIEPGDGVSYGFTMRASRPMRVATLPVGYADGYPRALSNRGVVLICGKYAPVVGRVCMDQTVVDVTDIPQAAAGSRAVLFGGSEGVQTGRVAALCGTIHYELVCGISRRVPRIYLSNGKMVSMREDITCQYKTEGLNES